MSITLAVIIAVGASALTCVITCAVWDLRCSRTRYKHGSELHKCMRTEYNIGFKAGTEDGFERAKQLVIYALRDKEE